MRLKSCKKKVGNRVLVAVHWRIGVAKALAVYGVSIRCYTSIGTVCTHQKHSYGIDVQLSSEVCLLLPWGLDDAW